MGIAVRERSEGCGEAEAFSGERYGFYDFLIQCARVGKYTVFFREVIGCSLVDFYNYAGA